MRAGDEGEVTVRCAADVEPFGIRELRGIAIGRADAQRHECACGHCKAADLDRPANRALALQFLAWIAERPRSYADARYVSSETGSRPVRVRTAGLRMSRLPSRIAW